MNVLIAPDAFKDSMTAAKVSEIMKRAVLDFDPQARCHFLSASDGGEGFLEAVKTYRPDVIQILVETIDPLGRPMEAPYLYDPTSASAYIELAQASGIELLGEDERNPGLTSTLGTGEQIRHAIEKGAEAVYIGLGGSATNDAATGIAQALGYRFLDDADQELSPRGGNLQNITRIVQPQLDPAVRFYAINDVSNPFYGTEGAAFIYARQKGATQAQILELDAGLRQLDAVAIEQLGMDSAKIPGAGAAGGSGYGLKTFLNADFISGTSFILELAAFSQKLQDWKIDLILTGEGKIDHQTRFGKFVYGIAQEALPWKVPVKAVCGMLDLDSDGVKGLGLEQALQLYDASKPKGYSFEFAEELLYDRCLDLLRSR